MAISRHPGSCADPLPSYRWGRLTNRPFAHHTRRRFHPPTFARS